MTEQESEGPFYAEPNFPPPGGGDRRGGHWAEVRNGTWLAFYRDIGPGTDFCIEHPTDPNFWRTTHPHDHDARCRPVDIEVTASSPQVWACRHGFYAGRLQGGDRPNCPAPDQFNCGPYPVIEVDESVLEASIQATIVLLKTLDRT